MTFWPTVGIYLAATVAALILSFSLRRSIVRLIVRIAAGILMLPILAVGVAVFLFWLAEPPTLGKLQRDFPKKRSDMETILRMSDEDTQFGRIAPDFLWREPNGSDIGGEFFAGDPKSGLSKARWDEYRDIYSRNGITLGIQRDKERDAFIMVDSIGLLNRGHTTGYLYCTDDPSTDENRFEPCTLHQDKGRRDYNAEPRVEAYSFQRLDSRWLAFDQGPS